MSELTCSRHAIRCNCILQQHYNNHNPPFFHFLVFSEIEDDIVKSKIVQCPNCGVLHKIIDICNSKILSGKEESKMLTTIDDIKLVLSKDLCTILEMYDLDISAWEYVKFIIENKRWGDQLVLTSELLDGIKYVKYIKFLGEELYKIETFQIDTLS